MERGGHLCVTPGHAIEACRETVRPRGAAFNSCSSLSQREVFFACSTSCGSVDAFFSRAEITAGAC